MIKFFSTSNKFGSYIMVKWKRKIMRKKQKYPKDKYLNIHYKACIKRLY